MSNTINLYNSKKRNYINSNSNKVQTQFQCKSTSKFLETPINYYLKNNKLLTDNLYTNSIDINISSEKLDTISNTSDLPDEISVGAILYNIQNNKVVLIQGLNKFYGFPKGHIENNETEIQTMMRELKEETNIDLLNYKYKILDERMVQSFYLEKKYKTDGPSKVNRINVFYIVLINEDPQKLILKKQVSEILKLGWFTFDNAEKYLINSNSNQIEYLLKTKSIINNLINSKILE